MKPNFDVIVLAGGGSRRLGRNKLDVPLGERTVLEQLVVSLSDPDSITIVGTSETVDLAKLRWATSRTDENLILVSEDPPGSGPAMGIAAGVSAVDPSDPSKPVVVLGGDMPFAARAIPALLEALDKNNVALLGDDDGTHQFLVSAWNRQTLITATSATQPGDSVRSLFANLDPLVVRDQTNSAFDIDTEEDLATARAQLHRQEERPSREAK